MINAFLFGYYALMDLAIAAIAWRNAWPILNWLGFYGTFLIGTIWGVVSYRADYFLDDRIFLGVIFLYLCIDRNF